MGDSPSSSLVGRSFGVYQVGPLLGIGGMGEVYRARDTELNYTLGSAIYAVPVEAKGSSFVAGAPEQLFSGPFDLRTTGYTLSADGTRFIMPASTS